MPRTQRYLILAGLLIAGGGAALLSQRSIARLTAYHAIEHSKQASPQQSLTAFQKTVLQDLERQTKEVKEYNPAYFQGGDPPANVGVCTDVVLRSYRKAGVDLYKSVSEDIRKHPSRYPISKPDRGIDHRRCKNLVPYFKAHAISLPIAKDRADWKPGDIVFWDTYGSGAVDHVGVIANGVTAAGTPTVVHHWPNRPVEETDGLYRYHALYHFRWKSPTPKQPVKR